MPYYAQINDSGAVVGVTQSADAINAEHMIPIESLDSALLGCSWVDGQWVAPAPVPEVRHITVGAFFDRFGAAKWGILADTTATVQAVIKDASVRKYIDLDNPELSGGIALLVAAGHDVDATSIINAPVQAHELP